MIKESSRGMTASAHAHAQRPSGCRQANQSSERVSKQVNLVNYTPQSASRQPASQSTSQPVNRPAEARQCTSPPTQAVQACCQALLMTWWHCIQLQQLGKPFRRTLNFVCSARGRLFVAHARHHQPQQRPAA